MQNVTIAAKITEYYIGFLLSKQKAEKEREEREIKRKSDILFQTM